MGKLVSYLGGERGAVSVEWIAVTFALIVVTSYLVYALSAGGLNPVREELNQDLDRVRITPDD